MSVIYRLHAAARWSVILCSRDLQLSVVWQRPYALDEAFPISPLAHDGSAVQVLQRPGNYLRRRGRAGIHEDDYRNPCIQRFRRGSVFPIGTRSQALAGNHQRALRNEQRNDAHSLVHEPASIPAKIQNQLFHALAFKLQEGLLDSKRDILRESALVDVSSLAIGKHSGIFHVRKVYPLPRDHHIHSIFGINFHHLELHLGARLAAHLLRTLLARKPMGGKPVDGHDLIPATQACLDSGRTSIRLIDDHVPIHIRLKNHCPDAAVGLVDHHLQIFVLLFRDVDRVRIQAAEHGVNASPFYPIHRQSVHIRAAKLLQNSVLNFRPLAQLEILRLGENSCADQQGSRRSQ